MNALKYLAAGAAAMAFAAPAMAESAPAGFRVEALAGVDHGSAYGQHATGVVYGVGAGYDFATGSSVSLGIDAEASGASTKSNGADVGRDFYAGGRISFAVSPGANLYIKGGYTNATIEAGRGSDSYSGGRVGVGGQVTVAGKAYVGAEYRYSRYQDSINRHQGVLTVGTRF